MAAEGTLVEPIELLRGSASRVTPVSTCRELSGSFSSCRAERCGTGTSVEPSLRDSGVELYSGRSSRNLDMVRVGVPDRPLELGTEDRSRRIGGGG